MLRLDQPSALVYAYMRRGGWTKLLKYRALFQRCEASNAFCCCRCPAVSPRKNICSSTSASRQQKAPPTSPAPGPASSSQAARPCQSRQARLDESQLDQIRFASKRCVMPMRKLPFHMCSETTSFMHFVLQVCQQSKAWSCRVSMVLMLAVWSL